MAGEHDIGSAREDAINFALTNSGYREVFGILVPNEGVRGVAEIAADVCMAYAATVERRMTERLGDPTVIASLLISLSPEARDTVRVLLDKLEQEGV